MARSRRLACAVSAMALVAQSFQVGAVRAEVPQRCEQLAALAGPDVRITAAEQVGPGTRPHDNPMRAALTGEARSRIALPAYCRIAGVIHPRIGAGGQSFGDGFELRLPDAWNGKFLFQGGGGMDGSVAEALGAIPLAGATAPPALLRGYAVVSTDSGHEGRPDGPGGAGADVAFAADQQARIDYFYGSIGDVATEARSLIGARYGRPPEHSYFMGCSNGGRSAMIAAQRYPLLFDGIIAGSPAFRVSQAANALNGKTMSLIQAAPAGADGKPVLARAFSDADLHLVANAVLESCDAADGLKDGSIDAPGQCHFQPTSLRCSGAKTDQCLSDAQVTALAGAFDGAHDSAGHEIYPGWNYDSGIGARSWRPWTLGSSQTAVPNALDTVLVAGSLTALFFTPPAPDYDLMKFDFDRDPARIAASRAMNDADSTFYQSFIAHGGHMLMTHGYSDPVFSARDLVTYYNRLAADNGGMDALRRWARLFLVPGMTHCGAGPALDDFDPLTALENWVEKGMAPDRIVARGAAFPGRARPLCPYPLESRYVGQGDTNDPSSFTCR